MPGSRYARERRRDPFARSGNRGQRRIVVRLGRRLGRVRALRGRAAATRHVIGGAGARRGAARSGGDSTLSRGRSGADDSEGRGSGPAAAQHRLGGGGAAGLGGGGLWLEKTVLVPAA